jgi:ATP-binding cassette subfamily C exporter for protease/lipase
VIKFDPSRNELDKAIWGLRERLYPVVLFSFFLNLLQLTPTLYMLQLSERVLTSRDEATLIALSFMVLYLYVVSSIMEWARSHLMVRFGMRLDEALNDRVFEAAFKHTLRLSAGPSMLPLNDLAQVRQFLAGPGLIASFDAPWTIIFLAVIFLLHPLLGAISLAGAVLLFCMTLLTERLTQKPLADANQAWVRASAFASDSLRNAEVISAMGMMGGVRARWMERYGGVLGLQALASDRAGSIGTATRLIRISLQSIILGTGAWLAINGRVTAGGMFAGSILMGRMLSPVELCIANWKGFVGARGAYARLSALLSAYPPKPAAMELPAPEGRVQVENLVVASPDSKASILRGVSFAANPGEVTAIIGPSASGKSTLARALVGVWPAQSGKVRLDGADIYEWDKEKLGPHVGYLPQDIELFNGTIAENIARFTAPDSEKVIAAAKMSGLHEIFLRFPQGYDTRIGETGCILSAGQRQRIGLARALYGLPALVVLDEPNSNLDDAGDAALLQAIIELSNAGRTVFVVTHRTNLVGAVDKILVLKDGQVAAFGPRDAVLVALRAKQHPPAPAKAVLPKPPVEAAPN